MYGIILKTSDGSGIIDEVEPLRRCGSVTIPLTTDILSGHTINVPLDASTHTGGSAVLVAIPSYIGPGDLPEMQMYIGNEGTSRVLTTYTTLPGTIQVVIDTRIRAVAGASVEINIYLMVV